MVDYLSPRSTITYRTVESWYIVNSAATDIADKYIELCFDGKNIVPRIYSDSSRVDLYDAIFGSVLDYPYMFHRFLPHDAMHSASLLSLLSVCLSVRLSDFTIR